MIENNIISDHFTVEELKKLKITPPDAKMYKKSAQTGILWQSRSTAWVILSY